MINQSRFLKNINCNSNGVLSDGERELSYANLLMKILELKEKLLISKIGPEIKIGFLIDHTIESFALLTAFLDLNVAFLPMDALSTIEEVSKIKQKSGIYTWCIPDNYRDRYKIDAAFGTLLNYEAEIIADKTVLNTEGWLPTDKNEPVFYQLTSGSSGKPKIAEIPYRALDMGAAFYSENFMMSSEDKVVCTVPVYHSFGLIGAFLGALFSGSSFYSLYQYNPRTLLVKIKKAGGTILFTPPIMLKLLHNMKVKEKKDFATLRFVISSGGSLSEKTVRLYQKFYHLPVLQVYGSTETGIISADCPGCLKSHSSVGFIAPYVDVKINQEGRLAVKSPTLFNGYVKASHELDENYFLTGDLAEIKDKEVILKGRISDFINVGGRKINVHEVKEALLEHTLITKANVKRFKDKMSEEKIRAEIESREKTLTETEVRLFLKEKLAPFKVPHEIIIQEKLTGNWKT
ncbi:class I adenylate-forming enzyme family protein [Bacillus halotolerans]|uniref:class I adenylate-forming enzyme family protein n=1 Tax=Bacillus halotolerans TaxID=260554 RepID=UPI00403F241B